MKKGRTWKYGDNVNTDVIFPGKYTYSIQEPEEMARTILWLLSDEASFISGALLDASGGGFMLAPVRRT